MLDRIRQIAEEAGREALAFYGRSQAIDYKGDESPVTAADRAAHALISERLRALAPDIPVVSEESDEHAAYEVRRRWTRFWLVDPLDG
ncbi:MAG: 3'(2'),5'-bisphosphate nucleotidase CysQ, partial [Candidatus Methylomirabilis sp.]|nr:3'(2'),5'-bisphosphate nucleotidase CysQ [Deltaproteobacteria bacterium]